MNQKVYPGARLCSGGKMQKTAVSNRKNIGSPDYRPGSLRTSIFLRPHRFFSPFSHDAGLVPGYRKWGDMVLSLLIFMVTLYSRPFQEENRPQEN